MKLLQLTALAAALAAVSAGTAFAQAPANDACSGAISLASSLGGTVGTVQITGPYDNTNATVHPTDPTNGFQCFGEPNGNGTAPTLDNTLWYTFVGDGEKYFIETSQCNPPIPAANYIDDGDTQIAIYTGTCGSLTPVACNEDGPSSGAAGAPPYPAGLTLQTVAGTTYYMLIDGFNYNGALSKGQFCVNVTRQPTITCTDPSVTPGTTSASTAILCAGQTLTVTAANVVAPTVGDVAGIGWVITNADISNLTTNPVQSTALVASYVVTSPAPATSIRTLINDGTLIGSSAQVPYGTYYWTPVVFGNATVVNPANPGFLSNHTLDPACTIVGTSIAVNVLEPGAAGCPPLNNACSGAVNLAASFGGAVNQLAITGPYDNTLATVHSTDPTNGFQCFGEPNGNGAAPELNNTLWFTFVGDGQTYFIETSQCNPALPAADYIDDGDTQIAIYSGTCSNLTPVACNEDGPSATATTYPAGLNFQTVAGTTYYMLIDGFNYNGTLSTGKFCVNVTKVLVSRPELVTGGFSINNLYPVPVHNVLNLEVGAEYSSQVTVSVKDMLGREVTTKNFAAEAGVNNTFSLNLETQSAGVYFVTVSNGTHIAVSKFVKE